MRLKNCHLSNKIPEYKFISRLLADQCFSWSSNGKAKAEAHVVQIKANKGAILAVKQKWSSGRSRHDSWNGNISFDLGKLQSSKLSGNVM